LRLFASVSTAKKKKKFDKKQKITQNIGGEHFQNSFTE
jgi:hypothetical protein